MRKVSFAVAVGFVLAACGGEETPAPKTPEAPAVTATPPTAPTAEAPKEEAPKESLAELQQKTIKGMIAAINAHDAKKLAGFYAEGGVVKIAGAPADASGREAIAQSYTKLFEAFKDYTTAPNRLFVKGDVVVVEWAFNGTHTGDLWGIKASEKKVGAQGVDVLWFTPEGQVKEHHVYYDGGTILSQIGLSKQKARAIPAFGSNPEVVTASGSEAETKNVEALTAMGAAMEAKKEADWLGAMTDTVEWDDMTQPQTSKGKAEAKKFFKAMTTGFPDAKTTVVNAWGIGDFVIHETSWTGTHKGAFFGIPATKKSVTVKSIDIIQYKDGKLAKGASYSNGADFMMQLGLMPKPGDAKPAADKKPADAKAPAADAKPAADKKPADTKTAPKK
ncbi:MAG: ester cyclase [Labilithrix sp.]|nr:ester cyclase [Labilithrix sp.]MBX3220932.1 ester cyclase [Labilithrix sp.]